jgi:hypothetical protein
MDKQESCGPVSVSEYLEVLLGYKTEFLFTEYPFEHFGVLYHVYLS